MTMASNSITLSRWGVRRHGNVCNSIEYPTRNENQGKASIVQIEVPNPNPNPNPNPSDIYISRRLCAAAILSPLVSIGFPFSSSLTLAREKRFNKKNIPLDQYLTTPDGLKYYDFVEGKGPVAVKGSKVEVHFDCIYRGITAVSSRESKLLAGNRIIAQPYEFKVGSPPGRERKRDYVENANGLFSAQAAPKPPPALYSITEGMRVGGKRTVIVPPEIGYGQRGSNEIPPGATFDLNIELLQVIPPEGNS